MADDSRRRQPLPSLPPLTTHQYPVHPPPFNPAANQEPISQPTRPSPVASPPSTRSRQSATLVKRERVPPPPKHRPLRAETEEEDETPAREQPTRHYLIALTHAGITVVLVGWSIYCLVRYSTSIRGNEDDAQRRRYAVAFTVLSAFALLIFSVNLGRALRLPLRLHIVQQTVLFLGSLSLLTPTLFNLAFVSLWHHRPPAQSTMSLVGRCRWDIDVVWGGGRSGQCESTTSKWGGWLAGAIMRFVVTLIFLIACHWLTWLIGFDGRSRTNSSAHRERSQSTAGLMNSTKERGNRNPSQPPVYITTSSTSSSQGHRRTFSSSNTAHAQSTSPSSLTYIPHHLTRANQSSSSASKSPTKVYDDISTRRPSGSSHSHDAPSVSVPPLPPATARLSPTSDISDYYSDVEDGGDLNRFAANFKTLVERVSRETEDGARLPALPMYNLARPGMTAAAGSSTSGRTTPPSTSQARQTPSPRNSSSRRSSFSNPPSSPPAATQPTSSSVSVPTATATDLDSHVQMQQDLLQAHRLMLLEQAMRAETYEHVVVLGGAVRRMSTIASVADPSERSEREPPWTPTSGQSSYATPMELTRSPTSSTARSGRRNPMSRHTITPPPGNVGVLTDSYHSERGNYTD